MATRVISLFESNNTDANFRAWINEIHNALIAFGWIQTSDTGQINFATVTRPTNTNIIQGYAVYRMNDSLQAAAPVYMRLEFGTGGTADVPSVGISVCIGSTDGAGNLLGVFYGNYRTQNGQPNLSVGGTGYCRSSGDASSFRMHFWGTNVIRCGWTIVVERDHDANGVDTADGVQIAQTEGWQGGSFLVRSGFIATNGGVGLVDSTRLYAMVSSATSQTGGGNVGVGAVRTSLGAFRNPMKGLLLYADGDFARESVNPISVYGSTHNYIMLFCNPSAANALNQWNASTGMAMLWE